MEFELNKIKRSMHMEVLQSFKEMLDIAQEQVQLTMDQALKAKVEFWTRQWNRMTGDSRETPWAKWEAEQRALTVQKPAMTYDCD